jgi:hypothetical protein
MNGRSEILRHLGSHQCGGLTDSPSQSGSHSRVGRAVPRFYPPHAVPWLRYSHPVTGGAARWDPSVPWVRGRPGLNGERAHVSFPTCTGRCRRHR